MNMVPPPPARFKGRTEFSITLEVPRAQTQGILYRYEYKEASASWSQAIYIDSLPNATEVVLDDLNPTCTYEIRIYAVRKDTNGNDIQISEPSEIAAVDTEVPGCAPKTQCCVIL